MSNKSWEELTEQDRLIRFYADDGVWGPNHVNLTIEYISGFEIFNTRPYHNYEDWGQGYRVTGNGLVVEREDLDDAVRAWCDLRAQMPDRWPDYKKNYKRPEKETPKQSNQPKDAK